MMYGYDDAGWGWMVVMLLVLMAFSAGVAALVVMLTRSAHPALPALPSSGSPRASKAHTILTNGSRAARSTRLSTEIVAQPSTSDSSGARTGPTGHARPVRRCRRPDLAAWLATSRGSTTTATQRRHPRKS